MKIGRVLALTAALLSAAPAGRFVISGIVIDQRTNQPIRRALVTITENDHPDRNASLYTAGDGRFTFTDVPASKFTLQADVRGQQHKLDQDGPYSTGVVTGPGLDSEHIVFRFPAATSLRLKFQDEEGEPVPGAQVHLFVERVNAGWRQILTMNYGGTTSEGVAHFSHLEPGRYFVAVTGRPWYAQNQLLAPNADPAEIAPLNLAYPITYYPNALTPEGAVPIQLVAGEKRDLQMTLHAMPAVKITISGAGGNGGEGERHPLRAFVEAIGPGGVRFQLPFGGYHENDGEQVVDGLPPGTYVVSVSSFGGAGGPPQAFGSARVSAAGDTRLDIGSLRRTSVSGKLAIEGGANPSGIMILLDKPGMGPVAFCRASQDGAFDCRQGRGMGAVVEPGRYRIRMANAAQYYVKSVSARGAPYADGLVDVREGRAISLSVVAGKGPTKLDGIAVRDGKPVAGAMVLLVPREDENRIEFPRDQSDSDGTFTLPDVPPGEYSLIAVEHGRDLVYHDPRVLAPYLANAQRVDVPLAPGARVSVNVQSRLN